MKSIKAHLQQRKPGGGLLGAELAQLTKAATSKNVAEPHEELMVAVTTAINSSSEASAAQQMRDILHKRLTANNPHKVWLATVLTDKVLKDCTDIISPVRSDLYQDLADIAGKPLDRYQENFKDEQRAKMHAFEVLRSSGRQAQSILRHTCKIGRMVSLTMPDDKARRRPKKEEASGSQSAGQAGNASGAATASSGGESDSNKNDKMTWEQVKAAVKTSLGVAASHTQMIQDLVLNITSGESAAPDFERQFLGELVEEVLSFRAAFEQLLSSVSSFKQDTGPLVKKSQDAIEEMNNVLELYQTQVAGEGGGSSSGVQPGTLRSASLMGIARSRLTANGSAARGGSSSAAPQSAISRSRSGPLDNLKAVGEALPAGGSGSGRRDKDRGGRDASKLPATLPRSNSGHTDGSAPHKQPGYCPPALATQQPTNSPFGQQQSSPFGQQQSSLFGQQQQQTSFMQAPQPTFFPQASFFPQQPPQLQQHGNGGGSLGHQMGGHGGAMPGFIPMSHSMAGSGAPPVLYMPVTGPDGQQGFAPVFQPQQQQQQLPSMFPSGSVPQQGNNILQRQGQGQHQAPTRSLNGALNVTQPSLPTAAAITQENPFGPPSPFMQPATTNMAAPSPSALAALAATPSGSKPQANGSSSQPLGVQRPRPPVRHRQPAAVSSSDPLSNIGQLDAPYTPAAIAASTAQYAEPAEGSVAAATYDSDSDAFPRPLSSATLSRAAFSRISTEGGEATPPVSTGAIPHSISAGSDIFPAETATGVLASARLPSFCAPSEALPMVEPSAFEAAWNPKFPNSSSTPAKMGADAHAIGAEASINLLL